MGTYESLRESGLDFAKMLTRNAEDNSEDEGHSTDMEKRSRSGSKGSRKRHTSQSSVESVEEENGLAPPKQVEEKRKEGSVSWSVYSKYIKAMGGVCAFFWLAFFFITTQVAASAGDYFLTYWTNKEQVRETILEEDRESRNLDVYIFTGLAVATVLITLFRSFLFFSVGFYFFLFS